MVVGSTGLDRTGIPFLLFKFEIIQRNPEQRDKIGGESICSSNSRGANWDQLINYAVTWDLRISGSGCQSFPVAPVMVKSDKRSNVQGPMHL